MMVLAYIRGSATIRLAALLLLLLPGTACSASDNNTKNIGGSSEKLLSTDVTNIGFVKNPPKRLTDKFPMCDAFLKVDWIDKKKKIGYSYYEAIRKTKDGKFKDKKMMSALVDLDVPRIDYDVYQYKKQGRLEEVFEAVRRGKVSVGIPMMINYKGETTKLYPGKAVNYDAIHPLLSDHQQMVCAVYPDEQHAWVIEMKSIVHAYSSDQIEELSEKTKESGRVIPPGVAKDFFVIDVNFDGKDDYIFDNSYFLMYSWGNKLYQVQYSFDALGFINLTFPPNERQCRISRAGAISIITDGQSYSLNQQCEITEMTSYLLKE